MLSWESRQIGCYNRGIILPDSTRLRFGKKHSWLSPVSVLVQLHLCSRWTDGHTTAPNREPTIAIQTRRRNCSLTLQRGHIAFNCSQESRHSEWKSCPQGRTLICSWGTINESGCVWDTGRKGHRFKRNARQTTPHRDPVGDFRLSNRNDWVFETKPRSEQHVDRMPQQASVG